MRSPSCERRESRAAVVKRSERRRCSSASDDELGGFKSAMREQLLKKVFASFCDTPLGLTRTFGSARAQGRPAPTRTHGRRSQCTIFGLALYATPK